MREGRPKQVARSTPTLRAATAAMVTQTSHEETVLGSLKTRSRAQPSARPASILRGSAKAPKAVSMTANTKLTAMPNTGP